jgi:hypothetical protein
MKEGSKSHREEIDWDQYAAFNKRLRALSRAEKIKFLREKLNYFPNQEAIRDFVVIRNYGDERDERVPTVMIFHLPMMLYQGFDVPPERWRALAQ